MEHVERVPPHGTPEITQTPAVMSKSSTAITVTWSPTYSHGSGAAGVTHYEVNASGTIVLTNSEAYTDAPLVPAQTRFFAVRAFNSYGSGPWSGLLQADSNPTAPSLATKPIFVTSTNTTLTISWEEAIPNGFDVTAYRVRFSVYPGNSWSYAEVGMNRTFTAEGLQPYTAYRVGVSAMSTEALGWGIWSYSDSARTTDVPGVPSGLRLNDDYGALSNVTTVWVVWDAADKRYDHSTYLGYDIEFDGVVDSVGTARYRVIVDLQQETSYAIRVRAVNAQGSGEWGDVIAFSTAPARRPETPDAPTAPLTSNFPTMTTIAITWQAPRSIGLPVTNYRVKVRRRCNPDLGSICHEHIHHVGGTYYEQRWLSPLTTYSLSVQAYNDRGWSNFGPECNITTTAPITPFTPGYLQTIDLPSGYYPTSAINLAWDAGSGYMQTGSDIRNFVVEKCTLASNGDAASCNFQNFSSSTAFYAGETGGVTPKTNYTFRVYAVNGVGPSPWSDTLDVTSMTFEGLNPEAPEKAPIASQAVYINNATEIKLFMVST